MSRTRSQRDSAWVTWGYPKSATSSRMLRTRAGFSLSASAFSAELVGRDKAFETMFPPGQNILSRSSSWCRVSCMASTFASHRVAATASTFDFPDALFQTYETPSWCTTGETWLVDLGPSLLPLRTSSTNRWTSLAVTSLL